MLNQYAHRVLFALALTVAAVAGVASWPARAQVDVPTAHIPPPVVAELSLLNRAFVQALQTDCAPDKCFAKGCTYGRHLTVDQPRNSSLPGIPVDEGVGSVPPQEYLTEAQCEFTHEKSVNARDVKALTRRLEQRLSRGFLKVAVSAQVLETVNKALAEMADPSVDEETKKPEEPPPPPPPPAPPEAPETWNPDVAVRELWLSMLPHFPWMIAIFLLTITVLLLIWAARRLGAKNMEERMLDAQIAGQLDAAPEPVPPLPVAEPANDKKSKEDEAEKSFAEQQEALWTDRIAQRDIDDDDMVTGLLKEWLRGGEFPMLARALFIFGDRLSHAFSADPELALKKVEFAEFFRDVDEQSLPSRAEFFRRLNQHAMSSLLLSQQDVQLYRSLREEFGSGGILDLIRLMPARYGAVLFALVPRDSQYDIAKQMPLDMRITVAEQLLASTRISKEESTYLFACIHSAREGATLPPAPKGRAVSDRGPSLDGAAALSVLLPHIPSAQRPMLFAHALERGSGSAPSWYEDIFFGEMLEKLTPELRSDLLLDVDVRGLAGWLSLQNPAWSKAFVPQLSSSLQTALRGNGGFASRGEQLRLAKRGQADLVAALKAQYARGKLRFDDLVA